MFIVGSSDVIRVYFWYSPVILSYQYIPSCLLFLTDVFLNKKKLLLYQKYLLHTTELLMLFLLFHYILYRISDWYTLVLFTSGSIVFLNFIIIIEIHSLVCCYHFLCLFLYSTIYLFLSYYQSHDRHFTKKFKYFLNLSKQTNNFILLSYICICI